MPIPPWPHFTSAFSAANMIITDIHTFVNRILSFSKEYLSSSRRPVQAQETPVFAVSGTREPLIE